VSIECIPQSDTCWIVKPKNTRGDEEPGTVPIALFVGPNAQERAQEYVRLAKAEPKEKLTK